MKKMLAAALAASMVMGLTACGGSGHQTAGGLTGEKNFRQPREQQREQQRLQQPEMRKKRPVLR